ncbi:hypothetical protein [Acinetobacter bereziniae]|uniref:hypothetical protein n=1 Tax=Acinetobacter bereziniae TaxID=106648 RepID=UPI002953829B|nr:hypothetical protein [Acinetobacter bereziniae]MDV8155216.1 hypothetical protein [Acinetobacter bereziniae]
MLAETFIRIYKLRKAKQILKLATEQSKEYKISLDYFYWDVDKKDFYMKNKDSRVSMLELSKAMKA